MARFVGKFVDFAPVLPPNPFVGDFTLLCFERVDKDCGMVGVDVGMSKGGDANDLGHLTHVDIALVEFLQGG